MMVKQLGCRLTAGLMLVGCISSGWSFDITTEYQGHIYRPEVPIRYLLGAGNYFAVTFDLNIGAPVGQTGEYDVQSTINGTTYLNGEEYPMDSFSASGTIKFMKLGTPVIPNPSYLDVRIVGLKLTSDGSEIISLDGSVGETHFPPVGNLYNSFFDISTRWIFGVDGDRPLSYDSEGSTRFQLTGVTPPVTSVPDSGSSAMLVLLPMGLAWVCQRRQNQLSQQA